MSPMTSLVAACVVFVGSHFLLSHPLRAPLIARMGKGLFLAFYSLVAVLSLSWMIYAFRVTTGGTAYWASSDALWAAASVVMLFASILFAGSLSGNPAFPDPRARMHVTKPAEGVFTITPHPMMWSFILWGAVHIVLMPTNANIVLAGSIIFLAFFGALAQDRKKVRQLGTGWQGWRGRTAFVPFGMQLSGKARWRDVVPSVGEFTAGTVIWLGATWAHGGVGAGIWRWI
jgi:uncharacterized membrane protein